MIRAIGFATAAPVLLLGAGACSRQPRDDQPVEQEVHAGDSAVASGSPGRHLYRCDDGRTRLVDFKDKGLTIEIRRDAAEKPSVLTAPSAGMQYLGDAASATFSGTVLTIDAPDARTIRCRKASPS